MNDSRVAQLLVNWEQVEKGLLERAKTKQKEPYTSMAKAVRVCIGDLALAIKEDAKARRVVNNGKTVKGDIIG